MGEHVAANDRFDLHMRNREGPELDVIDRLASLTVVTLRGEMAERMFDLFKACRGGSLPLRDFNCFGAVRYLSGADARPKAPYEVAHRGDRLEDPQRLLVPEYPYGFQISGTYDEYPDGMGFPMPVWAVLHAGIALCGPQGNPLVVEKNCDEDLLLNHWAETHARYFHDPRTGADTVRAFRLSDLRN